MNSSPDGTTSELLHPMRFVLSLESTFAARTFSGDVQHMTNVFTQAMQHPGFSFVEVLQSCPTYNKQTPHEWYQERVYDISTIAEFDNTNRTQALAVAEDITQKIAVGVLYKDPHSVPQIKRQMNRQNITTELIEETHTYPIDDLLIQFK